jgi:hypothetical protein
MDVNVLESWRVDLPEDRAKSSKLVPHLLVAPATESLRLKKGDLAAISPVGPSDQ